MNETTMEQFRQRFESGQFWTLVFDQGALPVLDQIRSWYYRNAPAEDLQAVEFGGFTIVSARKRHMQAWQLASILRQTGQTRLTEREIRKRDVLIIAAPENLLSGAVCAAEILGQEAAAAI